MRGVGDEPGLRLRTTLQPFEQALSDRASSPISWLPSAGKLTLEVAGVDRIGCLTQIVDEPRTHAMLTCIITTMMIIAAKASVAMGTRMASIVRSSRVGS